MSETLYSYVVEHDTGYAPHAADGYCTLVCCKFSHKPGWKNIVELAKEGDWVVGTGGTGRRSAGRHHKLIYAMKVTNSMKLKDYCGDERFRNRRDADQKAAEKESWRRALVSEHYCELSHKMGSICGRVHGSSSCIGQGFHHRSQ